ncbi:MAG: aldehyde dehydrogenase family protein, partial [Gordonia sp. (in: high G+C Gram-positive bacteria)]
MTDPIETTQLYIGGKWQDPHSTEVLEVFSPATGEKVGSVPSADATDVNAAVRAARASFDSGVWRNTPPAQRAAVLRRAVELINERGAEIGALVS